MTRSAALPGLLGLVLLLSAPEGAAADAEQRLEDVIVTAPAERDAPAPRDPTAAATIIDTRAAPAEVTTLGEVLADSPGVQVRRFGGLGDFTTVSIRGSSAGQVQVYLDGVPLSRADNEVVNLADLPLDVVDHVEVYRNATPLVFAQSSPGGVVNIVTRRPGATPVTAASASYGSFTTRKANLLYGARTGPWEYLAMGNYLGSKGDFTFTNDLNTLDNPADGREVERQNNAFNQGDVVARVGWRPGGPFSASLTSETFVKEAGVPGLTSPQALDTSLERLRQLVHLDGSLKSSVAGVPLATDVGTYVVYQHQVFDNREGELGLPSEVTVQNTTAAGGQAVMRAALGAHQAPGLLLAVGDERLTTEDRLHPVPAVPDATRLRGTVAAEDEVLLLGDRLALVPGLRWEIVRDEFPGNPRVAPVLRVASEETSTFFSPRFGARATPWPWLTLLGNVGRSARPPNLQELFGVSGVVVGNPELEPETAHTADVGFRVAAPPWGPVSGVAFEYTWFHNRIDDLIQLTFRGNVFRPENVGEARVQGSELAGRMRLWDRVGVIANYTHQQTESELPFESRFLTDLELPGRPDDEAYARMDLGWSPERPLPAKALARLWPGRLFVDANFIGADFLDLANEVRVGSRVLWGAGLEVVLPLADLHLTVEGKNLGDDQARDVLGFPLPGRSWFLTVSYGFGRPGEPSRLPD